MKKIQFRPYIGLLVILVALGGCRIGSKVSTQNLSAFYDPSNVSSRSMHSVAYNRDKEFSRIYLRMQPEALLALQPIDPKDPVMLKYQVTSSYVGTDLVDSGSILIDLISFEQPIVIEKDVRAPAGQNYVVSFQSSNQRLSHIISVERKNLFDQQDFLLVDSFGSPIFSDRVDIGEPFRITLDAALIKQLQVRYYKRTFPIATPPFSFERDFTFDYQADSVFYVSLHDGMTEVLNIPAPGFLHFVADSTRRYGKTVYAFYEGFPEVNDVKHMREPLRYLTTPKEYDDIVNAPDMKLAVDRFWLTLTGNADRARARIRSFYNRVEQANYLFSSYHEGWKTDRGLIYIIYGPPSVVYRTDDTEKWIYGEDQSIRSLKFVFSKVSNPFTAKDFSLNKSPVYKESWFNAVEVWRR